MALTLYKPAQQNNKITSSSTPLGGLTLYKSTSTPKPQPRTPDSGYTNIGGKDYPTASLVKMQPPPKPTNIFESAKQVFTKIQKAVTAKSSEGLGAPIGRALQKIPSPNLGTRGKNTFKATDTEVKIVDFLSNLPSSIANSYGKSLELLSTPDGKKQIKEGAKNLPKTISEVKTHIDNKQWGEAFETAFSNPALSVALDVADFIPLSLVAKKGLTSARQLLKKTVKEGIEEVEKVAVKPKVSILNTLKEETKSPIYSSAESFAKEKFGTTSKSLIGQIDAKKVTARDPIDRKAVDSFKADIQTGKDIEPIVVREEGGKLVTTDGSHRITAYQELGMEAPVIVTKSSKRIENLETIEDFYKADRVKSVQPIAQQTPKKVEPEVKKEPVKITNEQKKKVQENITKALSLADSPQKMTKAVDTMISVGGKDASRLRIIRASFAREMKEMSGASSGYYKTDFAHVEKMKKDAQLGPYLDELQKGINKIDDELEKLPKDIKEAKPETRPFYQAKVSKLGLRVEQTAIEKKLVDDLGDLPSYEGMNMKEQAKMATELLNSDPDKALKIALGQEKPPAGLKAESVFKALENSITDSEMARRLATSPLVSEASEIGQRIKALDVKTSDSPVEAIRQIIDARKEAIESKLGKTVKQATADTIKDIKKNVKLPDKHDWATFIEGIKC